MIVLEKKCSSYSSMSLITIDGQRFLFRKTERKVKNPQKTTRIIKNVNDDYYSAAVTRRRFRRGLPLFASSSQVLLLFAIIVARQFERCCCFSSQLFLRFSSGVSPFHESHATCNEPEAPRDNNNSSSDNKNRPPRERSREYGAAEAGTG